MRLLSTLQLLSGILLVNTSLFANISNPEKPLEKSAMSIASHSESFEGSYLWLQETNDDLDWTKQSGSTPSSSTGPASASDQTYYLYMEASSNFNKTANIHSPGFSLTSNQVLKFDYHMYGADMGSLSVTITTDSGSTWSPLWIRSGDQGNQWNTAEIDLSAYAGLSVRFKFSGTTGSGYRSDIAIDNFILEESGANIPPDESFETSLGNWLQASTDDMDWTRQTGSTTSSSTGPSGAFDGTYYIYTEASSPNYPSKSAIITSPEYDLAAINDFSFNYHMYGAAMGSVSLQISTNGGSSWQTLWSKSGNQENAWQSTSVDLSSYSSGQLRFSAVTGSNYTSDIAIDNLAFGSSSGAPCGTTTLSDENYVYTRTYLKPMASSPVSPAREEAIEEVTYFDGLGRPKQHIGIHQAGGTNYEDIVTHIGYDAYGREDKSYLPYPDNSCTPGTYKAGDVVLSTQTYYQGAFGADFTGLTTAATNPYSEKHFEPSPLNRVLEQGAPGKDWKVNLTGDTDHTIKFSYKTNTHDPVSPTNPANDNVRLYTVSLDVAYTPTLNLSGYYAAGELYKTVTKDENWQPGQTNPKDHTTEEFKDKLGRVVLKRTYGDSDNNGDGDTADAGEVSASHDTYYVYDYYENLTYVLPPKSEPSSAKPDAMELSELCYQYKYDRRNRLIEKKIPGKGWEYIVYNNLDQPVLTQDPNLEAQDKWLFTKYDAFGRVAYTGYISNANTRLTLQGTLDGAAANYETRQSSASSLGGTSVYYSNNAKPQTSISEIYTISYYDSYDNLNIGFTIPTSNTFGEPIVKGIGTKGLSTVTKTKVLGTSNWITTATGYDNKGRVVWTKTHNPYLGATDIVEHDLDFTGTITQTKTTHQKTGESDIVIKDFFTYDHMNRLKTHTQSINNRIPTMIAENTYDKLGQLQNKGVGNYEGSSRLQTMDYTYNIRGWLRQINDPSSLGNDLFGFGINYNQSTHGGTPLFNGNISETEWKTQNDNLLRHYRYSYDDQNRITSALAISANYNLSSVVYDKNGNITKLSRNGYQGGATYTNMDILAYGYNTTSNRLKNVNDSGNQAYGFKDNSIASLQYDYDANGNLTSDSNKGITTITYNHLNLPDTITIGGQTIDYTYDATGVKLRKEIPGKITDYAGGFVYEQLGTGSKELQFFSHPEGYVSYDNGQFDYVYNYVDHLGNVRLSYTDGNGNGSIDPATEIIQEKNYYPFGLRHQGYNTDGSPYGNDAAKRYGFGGKELQDETFSGNTLDWYDISARNYDPAIGRWMNLDPLAEQMRRHSPYNYAFDNPLRFIDPDGMSPDDVIITGNKSQEALEQLQLATKSELSITMDSEGKLSATNISDGDLSQGASDLLNAVNDNSITVNVSATDNDFISDNSAPLLGAFMGNTVNSDGTVTTTQEINPQALGRLDEINGKPGQSTLHEVTESYVGGTISQKSGVSEGKATTADASNPNSVYRQAHDNVVPQSGKIYEHFYNSSGVEVFRGGSNFNPVKLKYSTGSPEKVFHTIPKEN